MDRAKVSRTGDAIATAPGAVAISGASTIQLTAAPPACSYYREQITQIAADRLFDRDAELAELAAFCTTPDEDAPVYGWWRAPKWSGKTALMAAFALAPPPGVRVVTFFVTARWYAHDTREAFVDIVGDQLAEILGEPSPATLPPHVRDSYLIGLLTRAVQICRERGERLALLVDGLDEDRSSPHDRPGLGTSIAAALPVRPPAGMRILVSGRPNPQLPADVPTDHPLRDPAVLRPLDASPHAKIAEDRMLLELDRLLHAGPDERDLLGLLTAARGGLTAADLAELTSQSAGQVRRCLRGVAARTFDTRSGHWRPDSEVYLLGHEDLQATALDELGEHRLDAYRQRLHDWTEHYRNLGWPPQTSEYLLRDYHRLLADTDDLPRMLALATDPARHNRMLDLSGGDTTALTEITTTQDHIVLQDPADLMAMLRLAIHRDHLLTRNSDIPETLPAHWARRGHIERAVVLAQSITDPVARTAAMGRVAATVAATGSPEQAYSLIDRTEVDARNIIDPFTRAQALLRVVVVTASIMGDLERAEAIARDITEPDQQALALTRLAQAVARTGDIERARALIYHVEALARGGTESSWRSSVLMDVADALVQVGDLERAETIAHSFNPSQETWALNHLVAATTEAGHWERAEAIARKIPDPAQQAGALAGLAATLARRGGAERARSLIDHAEAIVRDITDVGRRAAALANLAAMVARTGDVERSRSLIAHVETIIQDITEPHQQMRALKKTATAITETGDLVRAEAVARSVTDPTERTLALEKVAVALARTGDLERAEAITRDFTDIARRPHPRTLVAQAIAGAGDLLRAEAVARRIIAPRRRELVLGRVAVALAQAGDLERAEALARDDIAPFWQELSLAEVADALAQAGELERAEAIARDITDPDHRAWPLGQIAAALAQAGDVERAARLLDQAETAARDITDLELQAREFMQLAEVSAEIGDHARVRSLIDHVVTLACDIVQADGRALVRAWVVEVLVQAGDLERADSVARDITDLDSRLWVLAQLVDAFGQAGDLVRVRSLIDHAATIARNHTDPGQRAWALTHVAKALVKAEDAERAYSLIDDAETIAYDITKPEVREWALGQVAQALVWVGDLERARAIGDNLSAPTRHDGVLTEVATAAAEDGDLEQAKAIAHGITDPDRQAQAMLELARVCPAADNEVTAIAQCGCPAAQSDDRGGTDPRWSLIAESLRMTEWEDCLEILTELIPAAAAAALTELDTLGWRPGRAAST